jgi:hypothetical protein
MGKRKRKRSLTAEDFAMRGFEFGKKQFGEDAIRRAFFEILRQGPESQSSVLRPNIPYIVGIFESRLSIVLTSDGLPPIPENSAPDKFEYPVLINAEQRLEDLVAVQNIKSNIDLSKVEDVVAAPKIGFYWVWMQGGEVYKDRCTSEIEKIFGKRERGGTLRERLFFHLYYPDALFRCFPECAGSRVMGDVPYFVVWDDQIKIYSGKENVGVRGYGPTTCSI